MRSKGCGSTSILSVGSRSTKPKVEVGRAAGAWSGDRRPPHHGLSFASLYRRRHMRWGTLRMWWRTECIALGSGVVIWSARKTHQSAVRVAGGFLNGNRFWSERTPQGLGEEELRIYLLHFWLILQQGINIIISSPVSTSLQKNGSQSNQ